MNINGTSTTSDSGGTIRESLCASANNTVRSDGRERLSPGRHQADASIRAPLRLGQESAAPSVRKVLQRSPDELNAFGNAMHLRLGFLLIQSEARSLLVSTDAHNVTNERKRRPLGRIPMNDPASIEPAQLEDHAYACCRGRASFPRY